MMRRRWGARAPKRWGTVAAGTAIIACGCSAPQRPGASAPAVPVIESAAPVWPAGQGLTLADSPSVVIDGLASASAALRLSDGRIVVAQVSPVGLSYFGADGRHLYDAGQREDGPDALRSVAQVSVGHADSVAVYDFAARALVFFDPNGGRAGTVDVARTVTPAGVNGYLPQGLAPDGRYVLQGDETRYPFPGAPGQVLADSTRLRFLARDGQLTDSSSRLFEGESFGFEAKTKAGQAMVLPLARPLGVALRVGVGPSGVWLGDGSTWELRHLDLHGAVDRIVRLHRDPAPLTPALRDSFVARFRTRRFGTDPRGLDRQFAARIDQAPFPATLPAFLSILVGADSTLWVQHAGLLEGERGDATLDWTLIGADGRWLGDLTMPPHFRPTAAGRDWVLGLGRGGNGAARVELFALHPR